MDLGWTNYIESQEKAFRHLCILNSAIFGYLPEEAENCDEGNLCPKCPFEDKEWDRFLNKKVGEIQEKGGENAK